MLLCVGLGKFQPFQAVSLTFSSNRLKLKSQAAINLKLPLVNDLNFIKGFNGKF